MGEIRHRVRHESLDSSWRIQLRSTAGIVDDAGEAVVGPCARRAIMANVLRAFEVIAPSHSSAPSARYR
jgi:hypothetical protein